MIILHKSKHFVQLAVDNIPFIIKKSSSGHMKSKFCNSSENRYPPDGPIYHRYTILTESQEHYWPVEFFFQHQNLGAPHLRIGRIWIPLRTLIFLNTLYVLYGLILAISVIFDKKYWQKSPPPPSKKKKVGQNLGS